MSRIVQRHDEEANEAEAGINDAPNTIQIVVVEELLVAQSSWKQESRLLIRQKGLFVT